MTTPRAKWATYPHPDWSKVHDGYSMRITDTRATCPSHYNAIYQAARRRGWHVRTRLCDGVRKIIFMKPVPVAQEVGAD